VVGVQRRRGHRVAVLLLAGGEEQFGRGPVELVGDVVVVVRAAAFTEGRRVDVRVGLGGVPRGFRGSQALGGEILVEGFEHASALGGGGGQVQRGRGGRRLQVARLRVSGGQQRQPGPLFVVDLVVRHAGERFAFGHLHLEEELHLPACFVEHVGHAVAGFGQAQGGVGQLVGLGGVGELGALVDAHDLVHRDTAVDHVFAVVARVVPAAGDVKGGVAGAGRARHVGIALVGGHADVAGRASVAGGDGVEDLDAAALRVVERQRVDAQFLVDAFVDVEGVAGFTVDGERVVASLRGVGAEVDGVDVEPGAGVRAVRLGLAAGDHVTVGVGKLPGERAGGVGDHGRLLGTVREVADLVDADPRSGVGFVDRGFGAAEQGDVVEAEGPRFVGAADLEGDLGVVPVDVG